MDMLTIVASAMLVIGCLYIIFSPFTQKEAAVINESSAPVDEQLTKQELYATLNEIEMDFKMDKLSEEDYKNMKVTYELMVADIMKAEAVASDKKRSKLGGLNETTRQQMEDEIEAELQALRIERKGNL